MRKAIGLLQIVVAVLLLVFSLLYDISEAGFIAVFFLIFVGAVADLYEENRLKRRGLVFIVVSFLAALTFQFVFNQHAAAIVLFVLVVATTGFVANPPSKARKP